MKVQQFRIGPDPVEPLFNPNPLEAAPERGQMVCHYTKWDTARRFILDGPQQLLINAAGNMNDPLEFQSASLLGVVPRDWGHDEIQRISNLIDEVYRSELRIFSTSLDCPPDVVSLGPQDGNPRSFQIVRPSRRGFDHPSMWAHYGEKHAGVCLIFDRQRLDSAIKSAAGDLDVLGGEVEYHFHINRQRIDNRLRATVDHSNHLDDQIKTWARQHLIDRQRALMFSKHEDWKHETEYRWAVLGDYPGNLFVPLRSGELVGVIAGSDFPLVAHEELAELGRGLGVPCRVMRWQDGQSNIPWSLYSSTDPDHVQEVWKRHEVEAAQRRGDVV